MDSRRVLHRVVALGAVVIATLGLAPAAHAASEHRVAVVDDAYDDGDEQPATTHVLAGDTVTWQWSSANEHAHTVTSVGGAFDSHPECGGVLDDCGAAQRDPFSVTFEEPGTYRYLCKVHGVTMSGTVEVTVADDSENEDGGETGEHELADSEPSQTSSPDESDESDESDSSNDPKASKSSGNDSAGDTDTNAKRSNEDVPQSGSSDAPEGSDDDGADGGVTGASRRSSSIGQASLPSLETATRWQQQEPSGSDLEVLVAPPSSAASPAPLSRPAAAEGAFPAPAASAGDVTVDMSALGEGTGGLDPKAVTLAIVLLLGTGGALTKYVLLGPQWERA